ncbi:MAG: hypothetical protein H7A33_02025 [Deltaproteobacteria bacterium]|nr:hypothetical protein [Deltaproteobacteria bacterium]
MTLASFSTLSLKLRFLLRAWRKRCPFCGDGFLYGEDGEIISTCKHCQSQLNVDAGESWFFLLLLDRALFIFPLIVLVYFEVHRFSLGLFLFLAATIFFLLFKTTKNRNALAFAAMRIQGCPSCKTIQK